jgi:hypothetical protein
MRTKTGAVTFRDNGTKLLRFVQIEIISHLAQRLFFFRKKPCQTTKQKVFILGQSHLSITSTRTSHRGKFKEAAFSIKEVIKLHI